MTHAHAPRPSVAINTDSTGGHCGVVVMEEAKRKGINGGWRRQKIREGMLSKKKEKMAGRVGHSNFYSSTEYKRR